MKNLVTITILSLLITGIPLTIAAHGVQHTVSEGATVVTATYDDGNAMAFCYVTVFSPDDQKDPYQEGISDRNGCFAFLPDTNGTWKVSVDDGMGHLTEAIIDIDSTGARHVKKTHHTDRLSGAVTGISIIFGCFGLYAMFIAHKKNRPANTRKN